eukprot:scaffold4328_cov135-Isochrysis_galbana.AAC.14
MVQQRHVRHAAHVALRSRARGDDKTLRCPVGGRGRDWVWKASHARGALVLGADGAFGIREVVEVVRALHCRQRFIDACDLRLVQWIGVATAKRSSPFFRHLSALSAQ